MSQRPFPQKVYSSTIDCTAEALEIKGTARSVCTRRQLISMHAMVYESSYTTCECMAESAHHTPWHAH